MKLDIIYVGIIIMLFLIIYFIYNDKKKRESFNNINEYDFDKELGNIPPIPVSKNCILNFNCVNPPYSVSEKHLNVCTKCDENSLKKNYDSPFRPLFVASRSNGTVRQTKRII